MHRQTWHVCGQGELTQTAALVHDAKTRKRYYILFICVQKHFRDFYEFYPHNSPVHNFQARLFTEKEEGDLLQIPSALSQNTANVTVVNLKRKKKLITYQRTRDSSNVQQFIK